MGFSRPFAVADVCGTAIPVMESANVSENWLQEHALQLGLPCNARGGKKTIRLTKTSEF